MTFRPVPARWFELLTIGTDVPTALDALARTGAVELEVETGIGHRLLLPDTADLRTAFHDLARTHAAHWPAPSPPARPSDAPCDVLASAWARLLAWRTEADPVIRTIEAAARETADLERLGDALRDAPADVPDLTRLARAGPRLAARLFRFPPGVRARPSPTEVPHRSWEGPSGGYLLVVGAADRVGEIETRVQATKGRPVPLPTWLPPTPAAALAAVEARLDGLAEERRQADADLAAASSRHDVAGALGDFALIDWLALHADEIAGSARLAWVTGWTSDETGETLRAALAGRGVRFLLRLLPEPAGTNPPLVMRNPRWVRLFEIFPALLGMPGRDEADPSPALAAIVPLLFGFMFGDVGQGLVAIAAGLWLGRRLPVLKLLVPGGAAAVGFGLLFGSVFCREDLIPALWVHPLAAPTTLLATALAGGAAVLLFGLALDAVQTVWRGEMRPWAMHRAGLVLAYVAVLAAVVRHPAAWGVPLGALWFVVGAARLAERDRPAAAGIALAEFLEQFSQLLVNTISFARIGAFALAHAGLSAAIVGVAEVVGGPGYAVVLVLGNLLVLTLEGLVVGIQTTRLVLFEFFIRFLRGGGRSFRPLAPPRFDWAATPERT